MHEKECRTANLDAVSVDQTVGIGDPGLIDTHAIAAVQVAQVEAIPAVEEFGVFA
jgi:hypothetical protein